MSETVTVHKSVAREAWLETVKRSERGHRALRDAKDHVTAIQKELDELAVECDKAASDYAAERAAEGANAVEGPDDALYTIRKARKRKGGGEPVNPYMLDPVKR